MVAFTQHFQVYLLGGPFELQTDHGSLSWLYNFKDPTEQLARWLEQLQEFDFEVIHCKGLKNKNAEDTPTTHPTCLTSLITDQLKVRTTIQTLLLSHRLLQPGY